MSSTATKPRVRHLSLPFAVPADADLATENAALVAVVAQEFARRGITYPGLRADPAARESSPTSRASQPPSPVGCTTEVELLACMRRLRAWAGNPSFRELQRRAEAAGRKLPHSTVNRALAEGNTRMLPHLKLYAFVMACGVDDHHWPEWSAAWDEALYFETVPPTLAPLARRVLPNRPRYGSGSRGHRTGGVAPAVDVDLIATCDD
jgi:hypothetical protein